MPSKKKRPVPLDLTIVEQDAQSVTLSAKTLPQNIQPKKKKKRGSYDPEVYQMVEQNRQEVEKPVKRKKPPMEAVELLQQLEKEPDQLDQAIQQRTPLNSPVKAVLTQQSCEGVLSTARRRRRPTTRLSVSYGKDRTCG